MLPEQAVDRHVEGICRGDGVDEEERTAENESTNEASYSRRTHDDVRLIIPEALEEREEGRLWRPIDIWCGRVVLALFDEALECAKGNTCTPVFDVMKQSSVKAFFNDGAVELLNDKMQNIAKSQNFSQGLVRQLIKSYTFKVLIQHFVKQQA